MAGICTDYSSTRDCFAYIMLAAPGPFPGNKNTTLESIFADIEAGVSAISERAKHPDAQELFARCRNELRSSYQLFKDGNSAEARKKIREAKKLFAEAGKLRRTKPVPKTDIKTSAVAFRQVKGHEVQLDGATMTGATTVAPALIVKRFGPPGRGDGHKISGEYVFLSASGDAFVLHDWLATSLYFRSGLTPDQFWARADNCELRVSSLDLDCSEFLAWLGNEVGLES
jgi:hypothetical protein